MSKLLSQTDGVVTYPGMKTTKLTQLQDDVLWIVMEHGPVNAHDIDYHIPIGVERARRVLARLEALRLIDAHYTSGKRGRSFVGRSS